MENNSKTDFNEINDKQNDLKRNCTVLTVLLNDNFKEVVASMSETQFLMKLPSVIQKKKTLGRKLYSTYTAALEKNLKNSWTKLCEDNELHIKLNILDNAIQQNTSKSKAWRPETGNITDQMLPHYMSELKNYKDILEQEVDKLEINCDGLKKEVMLNRTFTANILTTYENLDNKSTEPLKKRRRR